MKSTLKESGVADSDYPCLKKSKSGTIVLFIAEDTGTCLVISDRRDIIGSYSACWNEGNFKRVTGSITIEDDGK